MTEHRFWVPGFKGDIRLKMKKGDYFRHHTGGPTDEGYCWMYDSWEHNGDHIEYQTGRRGADCDGPYEEHRTMVCPVDKLGAIKAHLNRYRCKCKGFDRDMYLDRVPFVHREGCFVPDRPDWQTEESWQRDVYAEMAGY